MEKYMKFIMCLFGALFLGTLTVNTIFVKDVIATDLSVIFYQQYDVVITEYNKESQTEQNFVQKDIIAMAFSSEIFIFYLSNVITFADKAKFSFVLTDTEYG